MANRDLLDLFIITWPVTCSQEIMNNATERFMIIFCIIHLLQLTHKFIVSKHDYKKIVLDF